ncbi:hypothetical protein [Spirosoma flavum]|uniref:Uncharacterized protein n=1 Tax=Spirosoma flavum TaxID=2048557 RepID=A0ABW6APC5_9BACT
MFISFSTIDNKGQLRNFCWWFSGMEFALDMLSSVLYKGNQLVKAELIDNDQCTQLPVDAFDGSNFRRQIQQLESEWQELLLVAPQCRSIYPQQMGITLTDMVD